MSVMSVITFVMYNACKPNEGHYKHPQPYVASWKHVKACHTLSIDLDDRNLVHHVMSTACISVETQKGRDALYQ